MRKLQVFYGKYKHFCVEVLQYECVDVDLALNIILPPVRGLLTSTHSHIYTSYLLPRLLVDFFFGCPGAVNFSTILPVLSIL